MDDDQQRYHERRQQQQQHRQRHFFFDIPHKPEDHKHTTVVARTFRRISCIMYSIFSGFLPHRGVIVLLLFAGLVTKRILDMVLNTTTFVVEQTAEASLWIGSATMLKACLPHFLPMVSSAVRLWFHGPEPQPLPNIGDNDLAWWQDPFMAIYGLLTSGLAGTAYTYGHT